MKSWNFVIFVRKCNVLKLPKDQKAFKVSGSHYLESSFLVKKISLIYTALVERKKGEVSMKFQTRA